MLEGVAAAAAVGFLRGKLEDPATGVWNLPGTTVDAELLALVALSSVALAGDAMGLGQYSAHAVNASIGVGGHYMGQVMRRFGKTGQLSLGGPHVSGNHYPSVGHGVPPWDPTSYDPTQFAAPYDDAQAMGLATSGV